MALGDGIRRNVAKVSPEERNRLRDAFIQLDTSKFYPDGVSFWDKQEDIHKEAHGAGQDVHGGPAFLPWHRELTNRLEALLREVDPGLSLHYWDWTTDPRSSPDGTGATINLFSPDFMGSAEGEAGPPFQNFESTEPGQSKIRRAVAGGAPPPVEPPVVADNRLIKTGDAGPEDTQFQAFRTALEQDAHNPAHEYIGGTIGFQHFSFHDPFVFLLHSNTDRLWAMWQRAPGRAWRLDPNRVYGVEGSTQSITADLQPWAGTEPPLLRPWAPPDNQQVRKNCKDPSIVSPPLYDTTPFTSLREFLLAHHFDPSRGVREFIREFSPGVSSVRTLMGL
jgi:hypothetical protein